MAEIPEYGYRDDGQGQGLLEDNILSKKVKDAWKEEWDSQRNEMSKFHSVADSKWATPEKVKEIQKEFANQGVNAKRKPRATAPPFVPGAPVAKAAQITADNTTTTTRTHKEAATGIKQSISTVKETHVIDEKARINVKLASTDIKKPAIGGGIADSKWASPKPGNGDKAPPTEKTAAIFGLLAGLTCLSPAEIQVCMDDLKNKGTDPGPAWLAPQVAVTSFISDGVRKVKVYVFEPKPYTSWESYRASIGGDITSTDKVSPSNGYVAYVPAKITKISYGRLFPEPEYDFTDRDVKVFIRFSADSDGHQAPDRLYVGANMSKKYYDAQTFDLLNVNGRQDWIKLPPKETSNFIGTDFREALLSRPFESCATDMSEVPLPSKATTKIPKAASNSFIASPPKAPTKTATPSLQPMLKVKHEKFTPYVPMVTRSSGPAKSIAGASKNNSTVSSRTVSLVKPVNLNVSGSKSTADKKADTNSTLGRKDRNFGTEKDPNKVLSENSRTYKTDNGQKVPHSKVATLTGNVVHVKAGLVSAREHTTGSVCTQDSATRPGHQQSLTTKDCLPQRALDPAAAALPTDTRPTLANRQSNNTVRYYALEPEISTLVAPASTTSVPLDQQPNTGDGDPTREPKEVLKQVTKNTKQIPNAKKVGNLNTVIVDKDTSDTCSDDTASSATYQATQSSETSKETVEKRLPPHLRGLSRDKIQKAAPKYISIANLNEVPRETKVRERISKASPTAVISLAEKVPSLLSKPQGEANPKLQTPRIDMVPPHLRGISEEKLRAVAPGIWAKAYANAPSGKDSNTYQTPKVETKVPALSADGEVSDSAFMVGQSKTVETQPNGNDGKSESKAPSSGKGSSSMVRDSVIVNLEEVNPVNDAKDSVGALAMEGAVEGPDILGAMAPGPRSASVQGNFNDEDIQHLSLHLIPEEIEATNEYVARWEASKKDMAHIKAVNARKFLDYHLRPEWDENRFIPPAVDWDSSMSPINNGQRHQASQHQWMKDRADDLFQHPVQLDVKSEKFTSGQWIASGDFNFLAPPIPEPKMAGMIEKELLEIQQAEQTSFTASEAYCNKEYKRKEDRRLERENFAWATQNQKNNPRRPPPEWTPESNIYLRPAKNADTAQIAEIHNHYIRGSNTAVEIVQATPDTVRQRIASAEEEQLPFLVAVHKADRWRDLQTGKPVPIRGPKAKMVQAPECIVGFALAEDYCGRNTSLGNTVELSSFVHPHYTQMGICNTMLDRLLPGLDQSWEPHNGCEFVAEDTTLFEVGGTRETHRVVINVNYGSDEEDVLEWKSAWLINRFGFEKCGILPGVGFKNKKRYSMAIFVKETWMMAGKSMWPS